MRKRKRKSKDEIYSRCKVQRNKSSCRWISRYIINSKYRVWKCTLQVISIFSKSKNAGVIVGAKAPIILTSRADNEENKLNSIALRVLMAARLNNRGIH